ncbi:MAG TPA: glycosyltransferase [Bryobacteraceae bacterium]|nr:glycosyltransferase [Bryobacteraceae bacterium]
MTSDRYNIVILGLSVTSSWGNGHATTYRGLMRGLAEMGHDVLFLECNKPWYEKNRDLPRPPYGRTELYNSLTELQDRFDATIRMADAVIVGSYVPDGIAVGEWVLRTARGVRAFYDIDTPVTLAAVSNGNRCEYLHRSQIPAYDLYLSFTGGPVIKRLEREFGSPAARVLYCSVDPDRYTPHAQKPVWDIGYLGTYSADRQASLEELLLQTARARASDRYVVAGSLYPDSISWPHNVERIEHLAPADHPSFYNAQKFTLNLTRSAMIWAGYSPSVRLFEAAACGVPIISDYWKGLNEILCIGSEVLLARDRSDISRILRDTSEEQRQAIGMRARQRILRAHTFRIRALQLTAHLTEQMNRLARTASRGTVTSVGVPAMNYGS